MDSLLIVVGLFLVLAGLLSMLHETVINADYYKGEGFARLKYLRRIRWFACIMGGLMVLSLAFFHPK